MFFTNNNGCDSDDCYKSIMKMYDFIVDEKYETLFLFSGRGYNCHIFTTDGFLKYKKDAIGNAALYLADELKLDIDSQVVGDTSRICRIPNTFNLRRNKFCIPLTEKQLLMGDEHIRELANHQHDIPLEKCVIGNKKWDISVFDNTNGLYNNCCCCNFCDFFRPYY